ncbi:MAG: hypothetical protein DRI44_04740, partial [Chlamydiae bacterium]
LLIITDQQNIDAISAHGNPYVKTPNIDRLVKRSISFTNSYSTDPVCSPARSSILTGRMPSETGVVSNDRPISDTLPNIGEWLRKDGYETVYCGKLHLPENWPSHLKGFNVIPVGAGEGNLVDSVTSRECEAFIKSYDKAKPFFLVSSLLQPHDICFWMIHPNELVPEKLPFEELKNKLPELPPNHKSFPRKPKYCYSGYSRFDDEQWKYYLYNYYRMVEMVDADIGRMLDALEASGKADNTVVIFTSDHGEGAGRHSNVQKWFPYDEAAKVPLVISCPGKIPENKKSDILVSGLDIVPTICAFAGIASPPDCKGENLKPYLMYGKKPKREFVAYETHVCGRTIRTKKYKYVKYKDDPVEMLFDMENDPWEKKNIYDDPKYAKIIQHHRKLLEEWEKSLKPILPTKSIVKTPKWIQTVIDIQYGKGKTT